MCRAAHVGDERVLHGFARGLQLRLVRWWGAAGLPTSRFKSTRNASNGVLARKHALVVILVRCVGRYVRVKSGSECR